MADLGIDATVEKITDYAAIAGYGVMSTPALVVDEKVVVSGRVPTTGRIREFLLSSGMTVGIGQVRSPARRRHRA